MNISYFENRFQKNLLTHYQKSLIRRRTPVFNKNNRYYTFKNGFSIPFCSNDYLGLSRHPKIINAFKDASDQFGVGSGASQFLYGYTSLHHEFENLFAKFMQCDRALLFGSGYLANLGVLSAITDKNDIILQDKLNHASLIDAAILSKATFKRYQHNNLENLLFLSNSTNQPKIIVSDAVFSMTGELAQLDELNQIAKKTQSMLIVDDTHGVGVFGKNGAGTREHFSLTQNEIHLTISSLGKAFGIYGAMVCGSNLMIEYLEQFARSGMYSTALPPALAGAGIAGLEVIQNETWRREKLHYLISIFNTIANNLKLNVIPSVSPIQIIRVSDNQKIVEISESLLKIGYAVSAIRPPTVPSNCACLRITLSCLHDEYQIKNLLHFIKMILKSP